MIRISYLRFALVIALGALVSCGGKQETLCSSPLSVPSYTIRFSQGLDNFSEDQYQQLRLDSLDVLQTINLVAVMKDAPAEASQLAIKVNNFVAAMDDADWDVSIALLTTEAVDAATTLSSPDTLSQANDVDAFVISKCGLPTTLAPIDGTVDSLPMPSIPSPTQTDPPATPPNELSEVREEGRLIANIFGLTLSDNELVCLGSEMSKIVDVSGATANLAQYQGQFQKAFDACTIAFQVPVK